jgi:hypothetical protein
MGMNALATAFTIIYVLFNAQSSQPQATGEIPFIGTLAACDAVAKELVEEKYNIWSDVHLWTRPFIFVTCVPNQ